MENTPDLDIIQVMQQQNEEAFLGITPALQHAKEHNYSPILFIFDKTDNNEGIFLPHDALSPNLMMTPIIVHYLVGLLPEIGAVTFVCQANALRRKDPGEARPADVLKEVEHQYGSVEKHPDVEKMYNLFRDNGALTLMSFCPAEQLDRHDPELLHMSNPMASSEKPIGPFSGMMYHGLKLRRDLSQMAEPENFNTLSLAERIALLQARIDNKLRTHPDHLALVTHAIEHAVSVIPHLTDEPVSLTTGNRSLH